VRCRACGGTQLEPLLDLGSMPLAGGFLASEQDFADEATYELRIDICAECCLVQIVDPVDPDVLFQDYSFSATTVPALVDHFAGYAAWLRDRFDPSFVVEFGANDGVLIEPLTKLGVRGVGVDRSENITELARSRGHDVLTGAFTPELAREIRAEHGPADIVTGSNVFAHNADPTILLDAARRALRDDGLLALEMMYAGDLLEQLQWDTLYHEHLTFYSVSTIRRLLASHGFHVIDAERIPMHGGSVRVVASLDADRPAALAVDELVRWESSIGLDTIERWRQFARDAARSIEIAATTFEHLSRSASIWGYGAAGKATMWVNACHMTYLGGVVDASPLRAGKLMPGTHTPIVSPEAFRAADPDYVLVTAWNYLDGIRRNEDWYRGIWSTPLPELTFHR
jgi:2-polyprenyl-3-methyl-5-hydroxy-6-metoxy-1,4-benzoquinol methylase